MSNIVKRKYIFKIRHPVQPSILGNPEIFSVLFDFPACNKTSITVSTGFSCNLSTLGFLVTFQMFYCYCLLSFLAFILINIIVCRINRYFSRMTYCWSFVLFRCYYFMNESYGSVNSQRN
jgi:hypothetical protein